MIGQTVSHYRIIAKLGSGGMGVVYEAEDTRLGRRVALKFLPEKLAQDPRTLQRFEREARAASSLNHPSICTIYEVEEHDHQPVIVMELLEGQSLKDRIQRGAIAVDDLLEFGIQISDALHAAHAKGIIHRDIKPANLFLVDGGRVKILDFGLAKVMPGHLPEGAEDGESLTMDGVIPGTTAYMSPEQVRGEEIDARSDLFSLGVVLHEMATGNRPFTGENRVLLMNAILNAKPPGPSRVNQALPASLDPIIARLLEKDRAKRYQHAADLCSDLKRLKHQKESGQATVAIAVPAARRKRHLAGWKLALSAGIVVITIAAATFFYSHRTKELSEKDTIVLADFTNKTGDPVFDGTLRQGLAVQLEQSPFLSLVPDQRIQQTLSLMGQPPDAKLTPEIARELCQRMGGFAALDGSIASLGSQYVLGLKAANCRTGETLAEEQVQAARKEDVLKSLSGASAKLREKLGESLSTVQKFDTPLEQATTASLEALRAYTAGIHVNSPRGSAAAVPFFKHAIEIDPKFAVAYAALGRMYGDIGENALSAESTTRAYELRDRTSENEKFFISASYDLQVTGNLEKARQTCELWAQAYPRVMAPHGFLAGIIYPALAEYEKSVEEANIAVRTEPDFAIGYAVLASSYMALGRIDEAENALRRASEYKLQNPFIPIERYSIAFLKGDKAGMEREATQAKGEGGVEDWMFNSQGLVLAYFGHLKEARKMSQRAADLARQANQRETAALYETDAALREAFFGNALPARQRAMAALAISTSRDVEYAAAYALALSGDSSRSRSLVDNLSKRYPEDTWVIFTYLPTLRAQLALNRNERSKALELLEAPIPYELAAGTRSRRLYPVYVRGQAYLTTGRYADAILEFRKILDHRGIVVTEPIGALAYLGLSRAYALQSDIAKAKAAYRDFLTLWKDADPDIPILKQAKAEYAKLP